MTKTYNQNEQIPDIQIIETSHGICVITWIPLSEADNDLNKEFEQDSEELETPDSFVISESNTKNHNK